MKMPSWPRYISLSRVGSNLTGGDSLPALPAHGLTFSPSVRKFSQRSHSRDMEVNRLKSLARERIHVLGVGNIGRLFAHALAIEENPPPITLLLHRASLLEEWERSGRSIELTTDDVPDRSGVYDAEVIVPFPEEDTPPPQQQDLIKNLIVPTKTLNTVAALSSIKHRLSSASTILFAQNGMGTMEQVTDQVFPEISSRPSYLACVNNHGVYSQGPFRSVHAGRADMTIGPVGGSRAPPRYLIDKVVQASILSAREVPPTELVQLQLEKLVGNAMMNPLTVIFNCKNGELFDRAPIARLMRALLMEVSQVLRSLPEIRQDPEAASRFSPQNLEVKVLNLADKTAQNTSSMLQDFRAGKETEIDYINGHIVRRGKDLGLDCTNNEALIKMVKEKTVIGVDEIDKFFLIFCKEVGIDGSFS